jgi:glyoxylase-like metal-dependent hydrolase (beta-lactamase superfamily II)
MGGSEIAPGIRRIEEGSRAALHGAVRAHRQRAHGARRYRHLRDAGPAIAPYLASIGLAVDALDDLVVSHADVDHVGSNRRLRELSPRTRVWSGEADRRWIESNACMLADNYRWSKPYVAVA